MKPNPGGSLEVENIIGREDIIEKMWETLKNQSIILVSERRVGKTCILRKLKAMKKKQNKYDIVLMWVESCKSPIEFVEKLYDKLNEEKILSKKTRAWRYFEKKYKRISGQEIGDWRIPSIKENWKELLLALIEDIKKNLDSRLILMIDEFPLMLSKISDEVSPTEAMNLLDVMRDIREEDNTGKIRMVYCGSIGLHLIISKLKQEGYRNAPINNMYTYSVEGLDDKYAIELIQKLTEGCKLKLKGNGEKISKYIANSVDNFPYYIHHIMKEFYEMDPSPVISKKEVDKVIENIVLDPHDKVAFEHYVGRIDTHYPLDFTKYAKFILDYLSYANEKKSFDEILNEIKTQFGNTEQEIIYKTMNLLTKDHYIKRYYESEKMKYEFKYTIIKKWWKVRRT